MIGAKIFITEETEIIGNDGRARTELYLHRLCRARRRKTKSNRRERRVPTENYVSRSDWRKNNYNGRSGKITEKTEKAMCSVSNNISGVNYGNYDNFF